MSHKSLATPDLTIRYAVPADADAVAALAALDSQPVPAGALLVAEVEGELWAAVSLQTGRAIADPFRPSADAVALLRARARQLAAAAEQAAGRRAPVARLRAALRGG
ncbi:MAG: hypothetical protein IRZ32_04855 [Solirubrobacteraceae bacterium]|nr:hypothetical protein [Solirubrobacteraceae bacterium]